MVTLGQPTQAKQKTPQGKTGPESSDEALLRVGKESCSSGLGRATGKGVGAARITGRETGETGTATGTGAGGPITGTGAVSDSD